MPIARRVRPIVLSLLVIILFPMAACIPELPRIPDFKPPEITIPDIEGTGNDRVEDLPVGTPRILSFEVSLPRTDQPVALHLNGGKIEMNRITDYLFTSPEIDTKIGDSLEYYYSSGDSRTETVRVIVKQGELIRNGLLWRTSKMFNKPGFIKGHTVMDAGGMTIRQVRSGEIEDTYNAMNADGGEWFAYDYYWTYLDFTKPEIVDQTTITGYPYDAAPTTAQDIELMTDAVHAEGMKFFLMTELEWNLQPEEVAEIGDDWDTFFLRLNEKWDKGGKFATDMGRRLEENPDDEEVRAYWDRWFEQYEDFILHSARIAEGNGIELFTLGKQIKGPTQPACEQQWRSLIAKVREVYHGKITHVIWNDEWAPYLDKIPWADELDYITVYYWNTVSDKESPSLEELMTAMEEFNREQFDPLYERYQTPIIMLLPFQSRDYAAQQDWFEPLASSPAIRQDWIAQADLYEAFFETTVDEPWLAGVMSWGYWFEPDFKEKYSFHKSSTVRNKPASLVLRKWFSQIENK